MKPLPPIYSQFDDDLSMREKVETFVVGLAEHVDGLQDAELSGDFAAIGDAAHDLVGGARAAGYPALVEVAELVLRACDERDGEEARKAIVEITELAQRVRRGSRGAA